jgi:hypothetical protein
LKDRLVLFTQFYCAGGGGDGDCDGGGGGGGGGGDDEAITDEGGGGSGEKALSLSDVIVRGMDQINQVYKQQGSLHERNVVGLISDCYFAGISEEGSWGWESLLVLWSALKSLHNDDDDGSGGSGGGGGGRMFKGFQMPMRPNLEFITFPKRAVLRGCFLSCERLWKTLVVPSANKVEGVNMSSAFEYDDEGVEEEDNEKQISGRRRSYLRCTTTGDATQDAVPFNLHQWKRNIKQVGDVVDLLSIDLSASCWTKEPHVATFQFPNPDPVALDSLELDDNKLEEEVVHAFCIWIDYQVCYKPTTSMITMKTKKVGEVELGSSEESSWLKNDIHCDHATQGVLALSKPWKSWDTHNSRSSSCTITTTILEDGGINIETLSL